MTVLAHSPVINDPRILALRKDFPGLHQTVRGQPLVYLDNAATAQMPQAVVDALIHYHTVDRANIHRAVHELGQRATESYDAVRGTVARFLNAPSEREIVFVRGTTEAILSLVSSDESSSTCTSRRCRG